MGLIGRIILGRQHTCPYISPEERAHAAKLIQEKNKHMRREAPRQVVQEDTVEWVNPPAPRAPEPVQVPVRVESPVVRAVPRNITPVITFHDLGDPD